MHAEMSAVCAGYRQSGYRHSGKACGGPPQVLEEEEYVRRKVYYQAAGQRHYYFMNVGNGEVIDACRMVSPCRCPVSCAAEHYLHKSSQGFAIMS